MRQYHPTMGGDKVPVNPDCGIEGCTRAEYRAGLCRKHYDLRPFEDRFQSAMRHQLAAHQAAQAHRAETVALVQAIVDEAAE